MTSEAAPLTESQSELESWPVLLKHLPANWQELSKRTGALARTRGFPDAQALLRTLMLHVATGASLREAAVLAEQAGWADVSDVALLKRFRKAGEWFRLMALQLLDLERSRAVQKKLHFRMVDASIVKEPGKTGSQWRLHYSISLQDLSCDQFKVTDTLKGSGESLRWLRIKQDDVIVGDRAYSTPPDVAHVLAEGGQVLVRMKRTTLPLLDAAGNDFKLRGALRRLKVGELGEWPVVCPLPGGKRVDGRVCAIKKSRIAARQSLRKLEKSAKRKQKKLSRASMEMARYVFVFTTVPGAQLPAADALEAYRVRWQIELAFKRLKSLAGMGHLPKHDPESSKAWLCGKILIGLLVEKLIRQGNALSPWGYDAT
jgi:hypothetical protein